MIVPDSNFKFSVLRSTNTRYSSRYALGSDRAVGPVNNLPLFCNNNIVIVINFVSKAQPHIRL